MSLLEIHSQTHIEILAEMLTLFVSLKLPEQLTLCQVDNSYSEHVWKCVEVSSFFVPLAMHFMVVRHLGTRVRDNKQPPNGSFPYFKKFYPKCKKHLMKHAHAHMQQGMIVSFAAQ